MTETAQSLIDLLQIVFFLSIALVLWIGLRWRR